MDIKTVVGQRVRDRRKQLGMTQEQLAEAVGYSTEHRRCTVYQVEAGLKEIPLGKLMSYVSVLHTSVYYLLGFVDDPSSTDADIVKLLKQEK